MSAASENLIGATMAVLRDADVPLDMRSHHLSILRKAHPALAPAVDMAILEHVDAMREGISGLREVNIKLKDLSEKLSSPPYREGRFLGTEMIGGSVLLRVASSRGELLLNAADESLVERLRPGDRIYLTTDTNAVLGRCDAAHSGHGECAVAERWLPDGRLMVRQHDREFAMRVAADLSAVTVKAGDLMLIDRDAGFVLERLSANPNHRYASTDQATCLPPEALAGCDNIRNSVLRRVIYPAIHPEIAELYSVQARRPWILLGGPSGTGKSTFARVIAGALQEETGKHCKIWTVNGAGFASPYVGETEQRIKAVVREAGSSQHVSLLFLDEADAIGRMRGAAGNVHHDRFLNTLLGELDGFEGRTNIILVAATNRIDMLDAAFRSRFSLEINMPRPGLDAARAIFARHLPGNQPYYPNTDTDNPRLFMIERALARLYMPGVSAATVATLRLRDGKTRTVASRDLISGRMIEQICIEAREIAFQRHVDGGPRGLCAEDLDAAVEAARERMRMMLTPSNAHHFLNDLNADDSVVTVEPAARVGSTLTFLHQAAAS